jgi:putative redox protein
MQARIKWVENMSFVAESGSGHAIVIDGPPELGGRNLGARPMELLLMGLGACSSVDVVMILKKGRQAVSDCVCELKAERATTEPKVFTAIHLHFVVSGTGLNPAQVERAVQLSADKYCSASLMLSQGGVRITHDFEIVSGS